MSNKTILWVGLVMLVALALSSCATPTAAPSVPAEAPEQVEPVSVPAEEAVIEAALKVTGLVQNEMAWSEDEVKAMEAISVQATNKSGETSEYTGVDINQLLELAGIQDGAGSLLFVASDGYTAEVALADVQACTDCIVSFRNQGGFSTVLPGFPGNLQVKDIIEIQVK